VEDSQEIEKQMLFMLEANIADVNDPVQMLPLARRTLQTSNFRVSYARALPPADPMTLGLLLGDLIRGYCVKEGIPWVDGKPFLDLLNKQVMANAQELTSSSGVPAAVQRMWTSALQLRGQEFCSILNAVVRDDDPSLSDACAQLTRAINLMCVSARADAVHPADNVCFRGGGFNDAYRAFFAEGKVFRQPAFLATSFSRSISEEFIARVPDKYPKVLWLVRIDSVHKCLHVNLVTKRVPGLPDEKEYLFAPCKLSTANVCITLLLSNSLNRRRLDLHSLASNMESWHNRRATHHRVDGRCGQ
jgi:hypothetical protein